MKVAITFFGQYYFGHGVAVQITSRDPLFFLYECWKLVMQLKYQFYILTMIFYK
jgi:hypothetical protein